MGIVMVAFHLSHFKSDEGLGLSWRDKKVR